MRLVLAILAAFALSGCVVLETRPIGSYYQHYETRRLVGYDEWGYPVYDTRVSHPVVVRTVVVPVVVGHRHDSHRRHGGRHHGHRR